MSLVIEPLEARLSELDAALTAHRIAVLTRSEALVQDRAWRPVTRVRCGDVMAAVKEYRHSAVRRELGRAGVPSRAREAVRAHRALRERGFAAAPPLGIAEDRGPISVVRSYLVTRWVEGADVKATLAEIRGPSGAPDEPPEWLVLAELLTAHLSALHRADLFITDYMSANLRLEGWPAAPRLVLIDYDSVRVRRLAWAQKLRNFYQLRRQFGESLTDARHRHLVRAYLTAVDPGAPELEERVAAVCELTRPYDPEGSPLDASRRFAAGNRRLFRDRGRHLWAPWTAGPAISSGSQTGGSS